MKLVIVQDDYIEDLKQYSKDVTETKNSSRPYVGVILKVNNQHYFAPLASPKPKHKTMEDKLDFIKIKKGELGAINLNNMIPIPIFLTKEIDLLNYDKKYQTLLKDQINWINRNDKKLLKNSSKLYTLITKKRNTIFHKRCNDFKLLEEKCLEYLEIQKLEKKFEINKENYEFIIDNLKEITESIKDNNYNCLTGNQILVKSHSSEDRKWIPASIVKEEKINIKDNEKSVRGLLTSIEEGKLYAKPIEYYNISQLNITKEIAQKFVPTKQKEQEKTMEKVKDRGMER